MPVYQSPGVYIEEMPGSQPVQPAGTSTAAFVGLAKKGPVKEATLITNYGEFESIFGGTYEYSDKKQSYLAYAVRSFFDNGGGRCYIVRVTELNAGTGLTTAVTATGSSAGLFEATNAITFTATSEGAWANGLTVNMKPLTYTSNDTHGLFNLTVEDSEGTVFEKFENLSLVETSDNYIVDVIQKKSEYITLEDTDIPSVSNDTTIKIDVNLTATVSATLAGGADGVSTVDSGDFDTHLKALDVVDELNIVAVPDAFITADAVAVHTAALKYVDGRKDCTLILESAEEDDVDAITTKRMSSYSSKNAALYYPWISVKNTVTGRTMNIPPCGAIAGIYARTDNNRGVFKAPAGTIDGAVKGIIGLERQTSKGEQDGLNPIGVNVIRSIPGAGNVVWGARTVSPDAQWRYLPVRRLVQYIEKSLEKASQSAVFEPNDPKLWSRLKRDFSGFLRGIWTEGGLFGATEDEAFYVKIDEENNPQSSRDAGKLIINIGVAPVKPAEFIVLRIEQTQSDL